MIEFDFTPHGVCSRNIHVAVSDDAQTVEHIEFTGGCNGNLKAISKLVAGHPVEEISSILAANTCGPRKTSCADQLTIGLREASEAAREA